MRLSPITLLLSVALASKRGISEVDQDDEVNDFLNDVGSPPNVDYTSMDTVSTKPTLSPTPASLMYEQVRQEIEPFLNDEVFDEREVENYQKLSDQMQILFGELDRIAFEARDGCGIDFAFDHTVFKPNGISNNLNISKARARFRAYTMHVNQYAQQISNMLDRIKATCPTA